MRKHHTGTDFSHTRRLRAVVGTHRCEDCGRHIRIGEVYDRHAGVWEGDFFTSISCAHCQAMRTHIVEYDPWFWETYYGGIQSWDSENLWREVSHTRKSLETGYVTLLRLLVGYRARWKHVNGALWDVPAHFTK